jgi:oxygen-independent coproporphyrinogen III oxidase
MKKKDEMVMAISKEILMRKNEFLNEVVETIYFGGGTPSILEISDIKFLIDQIYKNYTVLENPEITLEANPDDLSNERIIELSNTPINRLSIGIQSFFEDDLKLMNRAHNSAEAKACLAFAT